MPFRSKASLGQLVKSQALAFVPLVVGLVFGALALPRSAAPEEIPSPVLDARVLSRIQDDDDARAARSETEPLGSPVRAVGSAVRAFNTAEATLANADDLGHARDEIIQSVRATTDADADGLVSLRAVQLAHFLVEVRAFERTGIVSDELRAVGGTFIDRMTKVGWCAQHRLTMPESVRRVAFKLTWNHVALLDQNPRFALALDETRALYAFYFAHPHASEEQRARFAVSMSAAPDLLACERAEQAEAKATAAWLFGKIAELGRLDPTYPTTLGQAAALYLKRDYAGSAMLYETWLDANPNGPFTLRAKNQLRAAIQANESALQ